MARDHTPVPEERTSRLLASECVAGGQQRQAWRIPRPYAALFLGDSGAAGPVLEPRSRRDDEAATHRGLAACQARMGQERGRGRIESARSSAPPASRQRHEAEWFSPRFRLQHHQHKRTTRANSPAPIRDRVPWLRPTPQRLPREVVRRSRETQRAVRRQSVVPRRTLGGDPSFALRFSRGCGSARCRHDAVALLAHRREQPGRGRSPRGAAPRSRAGRRSGGAFSPSTTHGPISPSSRSMRAAVTRIKPLERIRLSRVPVVERPASAPPGSRPRIASICCSPIPSSAFAAAACAELLCDIASLATRSSARTAGSFQWRRAWLCTRKRWRRSSAPRTEAGAPCQSRRLRLMKGWWAVKGSNLRPTD